VDAWNTWYDWYGNTAEGFAVRNAEMDEALSRAGRSPAEVERSACVLVVLERATLDRPVEPGSAPLQGSMERIAGGLRDLAEAGADEAILVVSPISERSIRNLGEALLILDA
jgi:alkanesulfonate monooxygenase SsuD/methylene tetrahydromethanopterin reductase-like flavin-dependent oxidoreductase (luciferase family)